MLATTTPSVSKGGVIYNAILTPKENGGVTHFKMENGTLKYSVDGETFNTLTEHNFTTTLKDKLDGIAENANNYVLPEDVVKDANYTHTDNNFTTPLKNKLDGVEAGANNYVLPEEVVHDADYNHTDNNFTTPLKNKLAETMTLLWSGDSESVDVSTFGLNADSIVAIELSGRGKLAFCTIDSTSIAVNDIFGYADASVPDTFGEIHLESTMIYLSSSTISVSKKHFIDLTKGDNTSGIVGETLKYDNVFNITASISKIYLVKR